jgi:hypothetical protein
MKAILPILIGASLFMPLGQRASVVVTDAKGNKVELTTVTIKNIPVRVGNYVFELPIERLAAIAPGDPENTSTGRQKTFLFSTTDGVVYNGRAAHDARLAGAWELGDYVTDVNAVQSVDFARAVAPAVGDLVLLDLFGFHAEHYDFAAAVTNTKGVRQDLRYVALSYIHYSPGYQVGHAYFIPLDRQGCVVGVPFAQIDTLTQDNGTATLLLRDGRKLQGQIAEDQLVEIEALSVSKGGRGGWQVREAEVRLADIAQMKFLLDRSGRTGDDRLGGDPRKTGYTVNVKTWQNGEFTLTDAGHLSSRETDLRLWGAGFGPELSLRLGSGTTTITFDRFSRLEVNQKGKADGQLTTAAGKVVAVSVEDGWIAGTLKGFGNARIAMTNIAGIEIVKQ